MKSRRKATKLVRSSCHHPGRGPAARRRTRAPACAGRAGRPPSSAALASIAVALGQLLDRIVAAAARVEVVLGDASEVGVRGLPDLHAELAFEVVLRVAFLVDDRLRHAAE